MLVGYFFYLVIKTVIDMRVHIGFNQERAKDLGIVGVNRAIIFDYLCSMSSWAEGIAIGGEIWYWVSRKKVGLDLEMLGLRSDTIYRHFCGLRDIGLIEYKKVGRKDMIRLTVLGRSYLVTKSEINPSFNEKSEINPSLGLKLGNKSEKNSEINPTYSINKKDSNKSIYIEGGKVYLWGKELMIGGEELVLSIQEFLDMRKKKKKPLIGERSRRRFIGRLLELSRGDRGSGKDIGQEFISWLG